MLKVKVLHSQYGTRYVADEYEKWVENNRDCIGEIVSVICRDGVIIVTYIELQTQEGN